MRLIYILVTLLTLHFNRMLELENLVKEWFNVEIWWITAWHSMTRIDCGFINKFAHLSSSFYTIDILESCYHQQISLQNKNNFFSYFFTFLKESFWTQLFKTYYNDISLLHHNIPIIFKNTISGGSWPLGLFI